MDSKQKDKILFLRSAGISYAEIGTIVSLPVGTVKAFCSRNCVKKANDFAVQVCLNCGTPLVQKPKQKPKRYCSDACRFAWWSKNRDKRISKGDKHTCTLCGKEYFSYDEKSKFCSHSCYISKRFRQRNTLHET